MRFADQVVWITGASSGIGEACARAFAFMSGLALGSYLLGRRGEPLNMARDIKRNSETRIFFLGFFKKPECRHSSFRIQTEGVPCFVNGHWLAAFSSHSV